jgi:hypothetical protein
MDLQVHENGLGIQDYIAFIDNDMHYTCLATASEYIKHGDK